MIGIIVSFFSPDVRKMMSLQPGQAQQTQTAPETAKASSTTSEAPKLNFQYGPAAQQVGGDLPYQIVIGVTTDETMQGLQLRIACDAACVFQSADVGKDAGTVTNRAINDRTIEVGLNQGFNSGQECRIVLRGKSPFHISAIDKM